MNTFCHLSPLLSALQTSRQRGSVTVAWPGGQLRAEKLRHAGLPEEPHIKAFVLEVRLQGGKSQSDFAMKGCVA